MADPEKTGSPTKATAGSNPESPTTARPLDFDDEPQETGVTTAGTSSNLTPTAQSETTGDVAPPKPPRPLSPQQEAENTLKEAFPGIEATVIKAVLVASGGNVEPAFNALLGMTDPNSQVDVPPSKPPRPSHMAPTSTTQSQLEADEMYARQLAEHYGGSSRGAPSRDHDPRLQRSRQETGLKPNELYDDREHSFFDDDLPIIRENIRKGFLETQTKVNNWVQTFKKRIDGEEEDDDYYDDGPRRPQGYAQGYAEGQTYRVRRSGDGRRSGDRDRYDADPQVLGDDFSALELRDAEAEPPRKPARPLANPDLFKSSSPTPERRRVSFQDGPPEEINDSYRGSSDANKRSSSTGSKSSKWQPLSAVEPSPVGETDPFSLGDSDDEKDTKNKDEAKKTSADAMASEVGSSDTSKPGDTSGGQS